MKKVSYLFCLLFVANVIFIGCTTERYPEGGWGYHSDGVRNAPDNLLIDEGVPIGAIDGVPILWATRNVDAPGIFAPFPNSVGMLFQWNRRRGWSNGGAPVTPRNWDGTPAEGTTWYAANDPCPTGWRVPTIEEIGELFNAGFSGWTQLKGVNGRFFGTAPYRIFVPAITGRSPGGTPFSFSKSRGGLWSSMPHSPFTSWGLFFDYAYITMVGTAYSMSAYSVRCVAK